MCFGKILTAMVTPFDANLEVDFDAARSLARYLVNNGSDGIVVAGTTGESPTLTKEEKLKLFEVVLDEVGSQAKIIAGTGSNNTAETIALTKAADKLGVHGVMVVVPYYNKPPQASLIKHFKHIAEVTSLPVMLYNVPGRTGTNLLPSTIASLAEIENIVAIKEASGDLDQVTQIKRLVGDKLTIYSGDDSLTLPMLALGCHGVISVAAHVIGNQMQNMIKSFETGDVVRAAEIHRELFPIFKGLFITANPIPVKAALNLCQQNVGGVRLPLTEMLPEELDKLKTLLEQEKII